MGTKVLGRDAGISRMMAIEAVTELPRRASLNQPTKSDERSRLPFDKSLLVKRLPRGSLLLNEQNLPISLAPTLDTLGISDNRRMRALGALPESALDKLEKG